MENSHLNENLQKILRSLTAQGDEIPEGWWSRADFQKATGKCEVQSNRIISRLGRLGLLETKKFKRRTFLNMCLIPHYKLKDGLSN
jgi:hypothetical protein